MKTIDFEHLYEDGRHYDLQHMNLVEDIPFFVRQARKFGAPILELACGTGRITLPIAQTGFEIWGMDISENMLKIGRSKAEEQNVAVHWLQQDIRNFHLDKKFKLIIFPFNSIGHFYDLKSVEDCFRCVRQHLEDDGKFIIDVFNPDMKMLTRDPSKRYLLTQYPDPDSGETVIVKENNTYDPATQINCYKWYYDMKGTETVKELHMRMYFPRELDELLHYNGFVIEKKFGNYDESPFISSSAKQLVVCGI